MNAPAKRRCCANSKHDKDDEENYSKYAELFRISLTHLEFPSPFLPPISSTKLLSI